MKRRLRKFNLSKYRKPRLNKKQRKERDELLLRCYVQKLMREGRKNRPTEDAMRFRILTGLADWIATVNARLKLQDEASIELLENLELSVIPHQVKINWRLSRKSPFGKAQVERAREKLLRERQIITDQRRRIEERWAREDKEWEQTQKELWPHGHAA